MAEVVECSPGVHVYVVDYDDIPSGIQDAIGAYREGRPMWEVIHLAYGQQGEHFNQEFKHTLDDLGIQARRWANEGS